MVFNLSAMKAEYYRRCYVVSERDIERDARQRWMARLVGRSVGRSAQVNCLPAQAPTRKWSVE